MENGVEVQMDFDAGITTIAQGQGASRP